jgi:hypothetical protein
MEMVSHKHPSMDSPAVAPTNLPQPKQKRLPIIISLKNDFTPIPASHHMIDSSGILMAQRSWHVSTSSPDPNSGKENVVMKHLTPK